VRISRTRGAVVRFEPFRNELQRAANRIEVPAFERNFLLSPGPAVSSARTSYFEDFVPRAGQDPSVIAQYLGADPSGATSLRFQTVVMFMDRGKERSMSLANSHCAPIQPIP
jgi:hypothetical protein